MATEILVDIQSTTEIRTHFVSFVNDLPSGVTVSSAAATHTPPSGAASTPTVGTITAGIVPVTIGPLSVTGRHVLTIEATLSSGDVSVARLIIPVEWDAQQTGLIALVRKLRGMANAAPGDYTIGGEPYWTDKQLQDVLAQFATQHYHASLTTRQVYTGGSVAYYDYDTGYTDLAAQTAGTAGFWLEDVSGAVLGTALYSVDYQRGIVTFAANTEGENYYWYGTSHDMNRAAAEVWRRKAAHHAEGFDFSTDNHNIKRSAVYKQCLEMATYYEQRSGSLTVTQLYRGDAC